jgi:hypothetical protein
LLRIFDLIEKYIDPIKNKVVIEAVDEELARRVGDKQLNQEQFARVMEIMSKHN